MTPTTIPVPRELLERLIALSYPHATDDELIVIKSEHLSKLRVLLSSPPLPPQKSAVSIQRTVDGSTVYEIRAADTNVILDHYDDGEAVLLVTKDGKQEIFEFKLAPRFTPPPPSDLARWAAEECANEITRRVHPELCTGLSDDTADFYRKRDDIASIIHSTCFPPLPEEVREAVDSLRTNSIPVLEAGGWHVMISKLRTVLAWVEGRK